MKIVTLVTLHHRAKVGAAVEVLAPGVHDLPESDAVALVERGQAMTLAEAKAEAHADVADGRVKVETQGKGPKVKQK